MFHVYGLISWHNFWFTQLVTAGASLIISKLQLYQVFFIPIPKPSLGNSCPLAYLTALDQWICWL